jgi:hypothetical protein
MFDSLKSVPYPLAFQQVGGPTLLSWFQHYVALMVYTLLYVLLSPLVQLLPGQMREAFWVRTRHEQTLTHNGAVWLA